MIKKVLKILFIISGSLIILLLVILFIIRAGYLNNFISNIISEQAGKNINAELTIGSIEGNLFSDFRLQDVNVTYDSDTLLNCREIKISYSLKGLLSKRLEIKRLHVNYLSLYLEQDHDSVWNFTKIVPPSDESDTSATDFNWRVIINEFRMDNLVAEINTVADSSFIPESLKSDFKFSLLIVEDSINVSLDSMNVVTSKPDFQLVNIKGFVSKTDSIVSWRNIELKLVNSFAGANGSMGFGSNGNLFSKLDFAPLAFEDILVFFPGLEVYGHPSISLLIEGNADKYNFNISISEEKQKIGIEGWLSNYKTDPEYNMKLKADRIDGSYWTHDEKLRTDISGVLEIKGKGFDIKKNVIELNGEFGNIIYGDYSMSGLVIRSLKNMDMVSGTLNSETFFGILDLEYDLKNIFDNPSYDIFCRYSGVNVDNIPGVDSITTDLNGDLHVTGSGISPETLNADLILNSDKSRILNDTLDSFKITAGYRQGLYDLVINDMGVPFFRLSAEGSGNIKNENDISFTLEPLDLSRLSSLDIPEFYVSGQIQGRVTGTVDSLNLNTVVSLDSIAYDSLTVQELDAEIQLDLVNKLYNGSLFLNTQELVFGDYNVKSVDLKGNFSDKFIETELEISVNDSLNAVFAGAIEGFEDPLVRIKNFGINYAGTEWVTGHDSASVLLNQDYVSINNFELRSSDQRMNVHGRLAFKGEENLSVNISNLELEKLPVGKMLPFQISGVLNNETLITGTSAAPVIESALSLDDLIINEYAIDSIRSDVFYENEMLVFSSVVNSSLNDPVEVSVNLPVHVSFSDSIYVLKNDPGFKAQLKSDSLDLQKVTALFPVPNTTVKGYASISADISNTISNPVISGSFDISEGEVENTEYGADYKNIQLKSNIEESRLTIDEFAAETGKGRLTLGGFVNLNSYDSLSMQDFELILKASDFQVFESTRIELNLNSDINIAGSPDSSKFGGSLYLNSSKINVDYFGEKLSRETDDPDPPLLIEAMEEMRDTLVIRPVEDTIDTGPAFSGMDLFKNLRGEISLTIPGNTWVTGKDMNIELEGSLRAVKAMETVSFFGDLNIKRGMYKIYGRSFDFSRGKLSFTGASDINPEVDMEIVYSFRDIEKELKDLKLLIRGRMLEPEIEFRLDDEALEEKDAISYIVFGKSINQLGEGERGKISGENAAMGLALNQLSSALKDVLQESAGVDVFEVTGGENWNSGNVTIGKYITNKLFLSYDRSFDFNKQSKTADTEKIMLEYQILRNLVLKATNQDVNSGFDLILKKSWR